MSNTIDPTEFIKHLEQLTHAGIAMVCASRLEVGVESRLQNQMPNLSGRLKPRLFDGYGPLSSFSAKIEVAFALGFITEMERRYLHAIRDIRNQFAHSTNPNLSFDHDEIRALCAKLPNKKPANWRNIDHFVEAYLISQSIHMKTREEAENFTPLKLEHVSSAEKST
jgi:hypothetical protein